MNICFFEGDMSRGGGTERLTGVTANCLSQNKDFNIFVLSLSFSAGKLYFQLNENVSHYVLCESSCSKILTISKLYRFIKSRKIDLLVNVDVMLGVFSLPLKCFVKIISWDIFSISNNMGVSWSRYMRKACLYFSDLYLTQTEGDMEELSLISHRKSNIKVLYNPVEFINSNFTYDLSSHNIITAGNFYYTKGFDIAVEVAKMVLDKHPDWKWLFYGDGVEFNNVKKKIENYNLCRNIILCGRVSDLEKKYREAAMYVMTSRNEGFGLVLLEAKNNNLPTISFDVPYGPRTIIEDNISGFLIRPFDINDMASKINLLIEDESLRFSFAKNAKNNMNKFSVDNYSKNWYSIIQSVCHLNDN